MAIELTDDGTLDVEDHSDHCLCDTCTCSGCAGGEVTKQHFIALADSDRVNHEDKIVYTSPRPGTPPVCTAYWTVDDWARWDTATARVVRLTAEAHAAGYRVVQL